MPTAMSYKPDGFDDGRSRRSAVDRSARIRLAAMTMPTCTSCGGRGGTYDGQGNWIKCQGCGGSGQTNY